MALPAILPRYTPEEYLTLERAADYRSEYIDGYIYAMSGGTAEHSLIKVDLGTVVRTQLRGTPCKTYDSDMQVRVDPSMYTYPDLTVACGESLFDGFNNLLNPTVIFEVLSPSTESYDRGDKFIRYQAIASLRQYVLVNQSKPRIEVFTRQPDNRWLFNGAIGLDAAIELESIGCSLLLRDVYAQVAFGTDAAIVGQAGGPPAPNAGTAAG